MLCWRNRPLVFHGVSLREWAFNLCATASLIRTVNVEAVIAALLSRRSPIAYVADDFIHKTGKMLQADRFATCAGLERKSTKAGKNLVKSLEASRAVRPTGIENVGTSDRRMASR